LSASLSDSTIICFHFTLKKLYATLNCLLLVKEFKSAELEFLQKSLLNVHMKVVAVSRIWLLFWQIAFVVSKNFSHKRT